LRYSRRWYPSRGIDQRYSAGLCSGWLGIRFPAGAGNFSLHHRVHTGSGAHTDSYLMGSWVLSLG
jgi:hypothetical protein